MGYVFAYKKRLFYRRIKAMGHKYIPEMDRMDVYHQNGSITSLAKWSKYDLRLGTDWVLFTKDQIQQETGNPVTLKVKEG